jgi:hypothetical protein
MNLNLVFAVPWLVVAAGFLIWHGLHPEDRHFRIFYTGLSAGWLALFLGLYNLARWYSSWSYGRALRRQEQARAEHERRTRPEEPPHPEFDFTRPEPPPGP